MDRRDLSRVLLASAAGAAFLPSPAQSQTCTAPCYVRTAAEITAGVTPTNTSYPPLCVDRYGTNVTPGTTSMVAAFNSAIKVAQVAGGTVTYGATGVYLLDSPVNCAVAGSANQPGIIIRCEGAIGHDVGFGLLARHTGVAVFDCTGADAIEFHNVSIHTDATTFPQTGILFARNASGSSQINRLVNCRIVGSFSVACFYNYGSEDDVLVACYLANLCTASGTKVAVWTAVNVAGLVSAFVTMSSSTLSCIDHTVIGCQAYNRAGTSTSDVYYLEQSDSWKCFGGWAYSASATANGRALIYIDQTHGATSFGLVEGLTGENGSFLQAYGLLFSNASVTPTGWTITAAKLTNATFAIATAGTSTTLDNFMIQNIAEQASHGLSVPGTLQNSIVQGCVLQITCGTSKQNALTGDAARWTITSRQNDSWNDTGTTDKTWTANTSGITVSGTVTTNQGKYQLIGNVAHVNLALISSGSLSATAGQVIAGLPFKAAATGGSFNIYDGSTVQSIGTASTIAGQSYLLLPAIASRAGVYISGTYFVA